MCVCMYVFVCVCVCVTFVIQFSLLFDIGSLFIPAMLLSLPHILLYIHAEISEACQDAQSFIRTPGIKPSSLSRLA